MSEPEDKSQAVVEEEPENPYDIQEPDDEDLPGEPVDKGAEEKEPEAPAEEKEPAGISDELLDRAESLGLSREKAKRFGDEALLRDVLADMQAGAATAKSREEEAPKTEDFEFKFGPDYEEPFISEMNRMKAHYDAKLSRLSKLEERIAAYEEDRFNQWIDREANKLDEPLKAALGDEATRKAVEDHMDLLLSGYESRNRKAPSPEQLFKVAVNAILGDKSREAAEERLSSQLESRENLISARPTRRHSPDTRTPEQRARDAVKRLRKSKGLTEEEEDDLEGLPDG